MNPLPSPYGLQNSVLFPTSGAAKSYMPPAPISQPVVLSANTNSNSNNTVVSAPRPQTNNTSSAPGPGQNGYVNPNTQNSDPYASIKAGISSAWDQYISSLNDTGSYLNDQQTAQQNIANDQLTQGQNTINTQKAASLKDIANTTRNAFQAGNNYLGSMGAGDSSASNQYAFAINQQAGKQTGDLNNFVNSQLSTLQNQHDQQLQGIASWFAQQQAALKQQIAQGQFQKQSDLNNLSTNILNQALQATNQVKANSANQYNALLQWAANNSQNVGQLQQNIAAIPQAMGQIALGSGGNATPTYVPGQAPNTGQKQIGMDIFGKPIYQ